MRATLAFASLLVSAGLPAAANGDAIEGTWGYLGEDAAFQVHLERNGKCDVSGGSAASAGGYFARCTYTLQWPNVQVQWPAGADGTRPEPLRLVLVGGGELMRIEGDARRPLRREPEAASPPLPQVNLDDPGAMEAFAGRDPEGYAQVVDAVDFVARFGCQGAFLGELKKRLQWEFISCGPRSDPLAKTVIGFQLDGGRYLIQIPRESPREPAD